jgi:hypothetical protein
MHHEKLKVIAGCKNVGLTCNTHRGMYVHMQKCTFLSTVNVQEP